MMVRPHREDAAKAASQATAAKSSPGSFLRSKAPLPSAPPVNQSLPPVPPSSPVLQASQSSSPQLLSGADFSTALLESWRNMRGFGNGSLAAHASSHPTPPEPAPPTPSEPSIFETIAKAAQCITAKATAPSASQPKTRSLALLRSLSLPKRPPVASTASSSAKAKGAHVVKASESPFGKAAAKGTSSASSKAPSKAPAKATAKAPVKKRPSAAASGASPAKRCKPSTR